MRRHIISLVIFSLLVSCSSDDSMPPDIIPLDKMKLVMYDMLRAQELVAITNPIPKDTVNAKFKTEEMYQQVFTIYKISRSDFYKSFHYYEAHPDQNKILLDSVSAYSDRKRQELYMKYR